MLSYISQFSNIGEYQPNMGLISAMERVEEANAKLREQVRTLSPVRGTIVCRLSALEVETRGFRGGVEGDQGWVHGADTYPGKQGTMS